MNDWLFKKDSYEPKNDKDSFIDKTIVSIIALLSKIKRNSIKDNTYIYKLNPMLKLLSTILILTLLSLSRSPVYCMLLAACVIFTVSLLRVDTIKKILCISLIIPMFTFIMLLPSLLSGNTRNSLMIVLKLSISLIYINLLSYTTKWEHLTSSLKLLFIPDIFIFLFDLTIKYIYILGEFSLQMLYALKLRSVGKNKDKYSSLSGIIGNLFIKSKELSEDMYSAMECRGFTGEYTHNYKFSFRFYDVIYLIINILLILAYFYIN